MPLHDHFHPPLSIHRPWQGFHSAWASALTHHLNHGLLPPHYFAMPTVQLGGQVEIDVATREERNGTRVVGEPAGGTAVWTAPRPALAMPVDFTHLDVFEVQVFNDEDGPRLVAAIELVSPANKDRESHRRAFTVKCAAYLQQGISLAIVNAVTSRSGNLHAALLELLGMPVPSDLPATLYAVFHRTVDAEGQCLLEAWPEALALGAALPTLPFWIAPDLALPLDLELSYLATCDTLRIGE